MMKEIHFPSAILAGVIGVGVVMFLRSTSFFKQSFPALFEPFWGYFLPIAVIVAFTSGLFAAVIAPGSKSQRTADATAVIVGMFASVAMLAEPPNLLILFLLSIAYGFIGFLAGSVVGGAKAPSNVGR